jgi:ORF6N domain-containing protein
MILSKGTLHEVYKKRQNNLHGLLLISVYSKNLQGGCMPKKRSAIQIISEKEIHQSIHIIRGMKVMLDKDLAKIYSVSVKALNQSAKRNPESFPEDFMFRLNFKEFSDLKSQFVTSSWGGIRKRPYAFTYNGVSMLASVLRSKIARQHTIFKNSTDSVRKRPAPQTVVYAG